MKKNSNFVIMGMLFMSSVIMELYFLLECRDTIALIIGGGAIVLLTTFLLLDWIQEYFMKKTTMLEDEVKFQKACYVAIRQMREADEEEQRKLLETLEIYKEQLIEAEENAVKLIVKCHREDIKCIITGVKESASKIASSIDKIAVKSNVSESVNNLEKSIESLEATLNSIEMLLRKEDRQTERKANNSGKLVRTENRTEDGKANHQMGPEQMVELFTSMH